jgi:membrane-associated phospholipid phosphatase
VRRWLSPAQRRALSRRRQLIGAALLAGYLLLRLIDQPVFVAFQHETGVGEGKWGMMFKSFGFLPFWLLVCFALGLGAHRGEPLRARAVLIGVSAGVSGLIAEILKRIVGRERPWVGPALPEGVTPGAAAAEGIPVREIGDSIHKPFMHAWVDDHNLGFPSSHVAVAFGAALLAIRFWPGAWAPLLIAAIGCAWQRLATGAHFLTDVYAGVAIAWVVSAWIAGRMSDRWDHA